jgi:8-oxo-dGTP diphosphatase
MALDDHHKHFQGAVAQKAFIEKDGKVLMVQYPSTDPAALMWDLPGGRLHTGETALEGVLREVKEEIGADISIDAMLASEVNYKPSFNAYIVVFKASLLDPNQEFIPEEGEIGKIEWVEKDKILSLPLVSKGVTEALKRILV